MLNSYKGKKIMLGLLHGGIGAYCYLLGSEHEQFFEGAEYRRRITDDIFINTMKIGGMSLFLSSLVGVAADAVTNNTNEITRFTVPKGTTVTFHM